MLTELLEQTQDFALDPEHDPQWVDSLLVRRHEQLRLHANCDSAGADERRKLIMNFWQD